MKKFLMLLMCFGLMAFAACGKEKESTKWIDESAAMLGEEITDGQFVLDGVLYSFPMDLKFWLANGWHISNNYDNADEFVLEAGNVSNEFELFNEDGDYVRVSVWNTSTKGAKLDECMVYTLYMSLTEVDVVFPQGITKRNKPDEILEAYGEPDGKEDENGYVEAGYIFESKDEQQCYVELDMIDNSYTIDPFSSVKFHIMSFDEFWDMWVENDGKEKAIEYYIDAAMNASFTGKLDDYVKYCIDTKAGATELYESEVAAYADFLMYYTDVNTEYVSDAVVNRFMEISKEVLAKIKWEVKSVKLDKFDGGTVVLALYPTNYLTLLDEDVFMAMDTFYTKYADADFESMSDAEYAAVEEEYAVLILDAIEKHVSEAGTLPAVEKEYELDLDNAILTQEAWVDVDDTVMDVYSEE